MRSSARKARLVLEHIRGKSASEATSILAFQTRAVAKDAGLVLKSAIANAETNSGYDPDELVVVAAYADEGPTLKRWRARARGRVNRIRKRTCHITILVGPALPGEIKPRKVRPVAEAAPAAPTRRKRGSKAAAESTAAPGTEPIAAEEAETQAAEEAAPEAVETEAPEAEAAEAEPEAAEEPEAEPEPEPAAESEVEAEPEPEPELGPEAEAETAPEAGADDATTSTDDEEADS